MRKRITTVTADDDSSEIDLTPMLDVTFIMLIFFVVTAAFIRETGIEVRRPEASAALAIVPERAAILVVIDASNGVWVGGQTVDIRSVRAHIGRLHAEDAERPLVVEVDPNSTTQALVAVVDAAQQADVYDVSIVAGGR